MRSDLFFLFFVFFQEIGWCDQRQQVILYSGSVLMLLRLIIVVLSLLAGV